MIIDDLLRLSLAEIWYHKIQSLLILGSVAIGIFAIFALNSVGTGIKETMFGYMDRFGTDLAMLFPSSQGYIGAGTYFSDADVKTIKSLPGVKNTCSAIIGVEDLKGEFAFVHGFPPDCYEWLEDKGLWELDKGSWGVAMGSILWNDLNLDVGETIEIKDQKFRITGLMKPVGGEDDDRTIYMFTEDAEKLYGKDKYYTMFVQFSGDPDTFADMVTNKFKDRNVQVMTLEQLFNQMLGIMDTINVAVLGVAFISLLVGGITISNTVYATIKRRTREIGMYKAVGAKNNEILVLFLMESAILSGAGGILGIGIGYLTARLIAYAIQRSILFTPSSDPALILGSFAIALLVGPISALIPAMYAARLNPTEALRYE